MSKPLRVDDEYIGKEKGSQWQEKNDHVYKDNTQAQQDTISHVHQQYPFLNFVRSDAPA